MASEETKGELSSPFLMDPAVEKGKADFFKNGGFLERKCNFSLNFPAFEPSVRIGPRSKVVICDKGHAWAPVLRSFDNSKR